MVMLDACVKSAWCFRSCVAVVGIAVMPVCRATYVARDQKTASDAFGISVISM